MPIIYKLSKWHRNKSKRVQKKFVNLHENKNSETDFIFFTVCPPFLC